MEFLYKYFNYTLIHQACHSNNANLVKYLISFDEINLHAKTI